MKTLKPSYILIIAVVLFTSLTYFYYKKTHELAIENAINNIHELLTNYQSYRAYVSQEQKQEVYRLQSLGHIDLDYFNPKLLSSTYSAKEVNNIYNQFREKDGLKPIKIKFASDNPRNPKNKATQLESQLIKKFNNNELDEYYEIRESNGKDLLYYTIPTQRTKHECMKCHSVPEAAPKDLLKTYGDTAGFNEKVGEIRALLVTEYPLIDDLKNANKTFIILTLSTFTVFVIILLIAYFFMKRIEKEQFYRKRNEKRLDEILKLTKNASSLTEKELCDAALDIAVEITDSKIGYLHTFNEAQSNITLVSWNKEALKHCHADYESHYPLEHAGIWADAVRLKKVVIHNDYETEKGKQGLPDGHFKLTRHMSAPVFNGNIATMIIGVGNKKSFYTKIDEELLQATANDVENLIFKKRAEDKLLEQKEEFESIFKTTGDGIAIVDLNTKFLNCNDAFIKLTGYEKEELFTKTCKELTLEDDWQKNEDAINYAITQGHIENIEKRCIHKNGKVFTVHFSLTLMPDKQRILLSVKDMTSFKLLEEQSKMVSMGEMVGNIAHQWRQPLSVISSGATGMMVQKQFKELSDEEFENTCTLINDNAQYLSKTIDDFKNFIKNEREYSNFNLKENIDSFLNLVQPSLKRDNIHLICDIDQSINLRGYPNELIQCFMNIFNNAKDALKESDHNKKYIFIKAFKEKNQLIIKFRDNAGGIPENVLPKIFEPYFTTKHQSQGTGLGLSMTYNLITKGMQGTISAGNVNFNYENKAYQGAELTILLPLEDK